MAKRVAAKKATSAEYLKGWSDGRKFALACLVKGDSWAWTRVQRGIARNMQVGGREAGRAQR